VSEALANEFPHDLKRLLDAAGARISFVRLIEHGAQYRITRGPETATVNVYTSGKISAGGKRSSLLTLLEDWRLAQFNVVEKKRSGEPAGFLSEPDGGTPRAGTDEAGRKRSD